ncbi:MAG: hypothetical protein JRN62_03260 [Nitrososphaerota archaeon]|jgi:hypothetical protein|nr:hypothetical protein [Nitrososphaerota archaeon]MDG6948616.1 hypothetical protein [Nitrososphaerota archaeon]
MDPKPVSRTELQAKNDDYSAGEYSVDLCVYDNGAISLSRNAGTHFIYLYPEQVKQALKEIREKAPKREIDPTVLLSL